MRLLVVGGGITGLAAAWQAVRTTPGPAPQVVLVESSDDLGGKLRTEVADGLLIEHGPDSFVSYRPAAVNLAAEIGLGDHVIGTSGSRQVFLNSRGKLRPLPQGMGMVLPTRLLPFVFTGILSPLDKLRAGADLVLPRQLRDDQDIAIGAFLRRRLGGGIVTRFADPMVGGVYGASVDELSLDAVLPSLREDETTYRSLMLASLAAGRRARKAAAGRGPSSPFKTFRGGVGSLVAALAQALVAAGVQIRTGTTVEALQPTPGGGVVAALNDGTTVDADAIVLAGGVRSSASLLTAVAPTSAEALAAIPLATSNVVTLAYPAKASPSPVTMHGWLEADRAPISGVTVSSAKWAARASDDTVLIRAFIPERVGPIANAQDAELLAAVRAHVESVMRLRSAPTLTRITRWNEVMPKYTVGHRDRVAAVTAGLDGLPAWRVAGSALRGVGIPDCISDGRAQAVLACEAAR